MFELAAGVFVMVIEFAVLPEKREEFVATTAEHVRAVRSFDGNLQFDVLTDPKRPDVVVYVERWESAEKQQKFYDWWVANGLTEKLQPYVTTMPKTSSYTQAID